MDDLKWCMKQRNGLQLIESNTNLSEANIKKAENSLKSMRAHITREWKISTAYYTMYFSVYAILMKIGVKCEIHKCTLEFARRFLKDFFDEKEIFFLKNSLKARIDAQYYIDRNVSDEQLDSMIEMAPEILSKCRTIIEKLDESTILRIREKFKKPF